MLKKVLITLGTLVVLLLAALIALVNWMRNPYGLEPERIAPKGDEEIPAISLVQNAKNYLLYSKHVENAFVIHLPIPNEYIHPTNTTTRISKSYAATVTMYYPEMHGKFHPDNADLPKCNGFCGGYMLVFISPSEYTAHTLNARMLDILRKERVQDSPYFFFEDADSEFGLDEHFQKRFPVIEKKMDGAKDSAVEYFLKKDEKGELEYFFRCRPNTASPSCRVKFNLSSRPELLVDISFGRHLMPKWRDVIHSTDAMIMRWGPLRIETLSKRHP